MPRWLGRLLYALRGKRRVRIHCITPASGDGAGGVKEISIEGVLLGRWAGHYVLELPRVLTSDSSSIALEHMAEIPTERVIFIEVLARGRRW